MEKLRRGCMTTWDLGLIMRPLGDGVPRCCIVLMEVGKELNHMKS